MLPSEPAAMETVGFDYWRLFRDLPEACLLFEAAEPYVVVEINKTCEQLMGAARQKVLGLPLFTVFPDTSQKFKDTGVNDMHEYIRGVIRGGRPKPRDAFRYDIKDPQGVLRVRYWRVSFMPLADASGVVRHVLAISHDVSGEVRAARHAASAEDRLQTALVIGKVGSWLWNINTNTITSDRNLARLLHLSKERLARGVRIEDLVTAIHPEHRARIQRAIRRSIEDRVPFEEEYRIMLSDGTQRWVLARGKVEEQDGVLLFPGVVVDITERHDLQAQVELARRQDELNRRAAKVLQKRNEELEAIGHSKDEFVALASHQLRTPATAVKQYLGMVLQGYTGPLTEMQAEMLHRAFESNERQIQIINQILNAARVDTGRLVMSPIPLDLCKLARGVWNDIRPLFEQRNQHYTLKLPRREVMVRADQAYLRMAIENLLHNASVYTPEGGTVTLQLTKASDGCRLSVTDTGVGIRKSDFTKLFAKFSRIHNPLSVQAGGSGIGLYLASEIVRLHGGSIGVESRLRKGSTFAISLPVMQNTA